MSVSATAPVPAAPAGNHGATAILEVAERLYAMQPEWVIFFREVLGVDGIVRRTFRDTDSLIRFECSPQYARIREMLNELRNRQQEQPSQRVTQRVVTVRMPRALHETLKAEAEQMRVSINTLCISKLIQLLDGGKDTSMGALQNHAADSREAGVHSGEAMRLKKIGLE